MCKQKQTPDPECNIKHWCKNYEYYTYLSNFPTIINEFLLEKISCTELLHVVNPKVVDNQLFLQLLHYKEIKSLVLTDK